MAVARLKPDVSLERAREDMARISRELETVDDANEGWTMVARSIHEYMASDLRTALYVLAGAVGFVLLVACANVANLLLARGMARQRELAVRAALGASRSRLVRQLLTEHLLLGLAGGILGALLAWGLLRVLVSTAPEALPRWAGSASTPRRSDSRCSSRSCHHSSSASSRQCASRART